MGDEKGDGLGQSGAVFGSPLGCGPGNQFGNCRRVEESSAGINYVTESSIGWPWDTGYGCGGLEG